MTNYIINPVVHKCIGCSSCVYVSNNVRQEHAICAKCDEYKSRAYEKKYTLKKGVIGE